MDIDLDTITHPNVHHGRNVKRLREILNIKQENLAAKLELTQQAVSKLESKEIIEEETLVKIAEVMQVPVEAIKNFDEQSTLSFVANTFNAHTSISSPYFNCTFNPIDKIMELFEENKKLYERLLEAEKEKNKNRK